MWVARDVARRFLASQGLRPPVSETQIDFIFAKLGIRVVRFPTNCPFEEFRHGRVIGIRADVVGPKRFRLKLHGLGHFLMHCGDQFIDLIPVGKQERQTEEFIGYCVAGEASVPLFESAYRWGVAASVVSSWLVGLFFF